MKACLMQPQGPGTQTAGTLPVLGITVVYKKQRVTALLEQSLLSHSQYLPQSPLLPKRVLQRYKKSEILFCGERIKRSSCGSFTFD